jgi:hypothetical protein
MFSLGKLRRWGASTDERRRSPRRKLITTAWIDVGDGVPRVAVLWNISLNGACMTVADKDDIPDTFALSFVRSARPNLFCRVVWRSGQKVGIEFQTPLAPAALESLRE